MSDDALLPDSEDQIPGEEPVDEENGPEKKSKGKRTVRKRRRKRSRRDQSEEALYKQKDELLREMHEVGSVGVKEQVERVRLARKARDEGRPVEESWGGRKRRRYGPKWYALAFFSVLIPVLVIVIAFQGLRNEVPPTLEPPKTLDFGNPAEDDGESFVPSGPTAWFVKHPSETYDSAVAILKALNEVEAGKLPDVFRHQERSAEKIAREGIGWTSPFLVDDPRELHWTMGESGDTGFMRVKGRRQDHTPFWAYFVKTDKGVRLDWEATAAWSEVTISELEENAPERSVLVRCFLEKQPHYESSVGPWREYSWYLVRLPNEEGHVWAYTRNDENGERSPVDQKIRNAMNYGWMVLDRKDEIRAIVRLRKAEEEVGPKEFEIEEFVTEEWVMP